MTGTDWVNQTVERLREDEDEFYASIGAYDKAAFASYLLNETERLVGIAEELRGYDWDMAYPTGVCYPKDVDPWDDLLWTDLVADNRDLPYEGLTDILVAATLGY